jgi:deoxycytidylate deaminase
MSTIKTTIAENELKYYSSTNSSTNSSNNESKNELINSSTTFGKFMGIFRFNKSECDDIKAYSVDEADDRNANDTDTNCVDLERGINNLGNNCKNTRDISKDTKDNRANIKDYKSILEIKIDGGRYVDNSECRTNRPTDVNKLVNANKLSDINDQIVRPSWDSVFVQFMETLAQRSLCLKYKTSALVVKGTQIISMGYNGTFNGKKECCSFWLEYYEKHKNDNLSVPKKYKKYNEAKGVFVDTYNTLCKQNSSNAQVDDGFGKFINSNDFRMLHRDWSIANEVHAEINALNWIPKGNVDSSYILYTLYSPCDNCAKTIISYGIKNIVYKYKYKHGDMALMRFAENSVTCKQVHE